MGDVNQLSEDWCGHKGEYVVTAFLCGRGAAADQTVRCLTEGCGRDYLASDLAAWRAAAKAGPGSDLCDHDMLRASCVYCHAGRPARRKATSPRPASQSARFAARYTSSCAECPTMIKPDDSIMRNPFGRGYLCPACSDDAETEP